MPRLANPSVPVSWGELLDKMTILEIKHARIASDEAQANVAREYEALRGFGDLALHEAEVAPLVASLKQVNEELWDIEDAIRAEEADAAFGTRFIRLARSVYKKNDERAAIKRAINRCLESALIEEKSYAAVAR
jgi:hypothetical protein